jgi:MFS family permease
VFSGTIMLLVPTLQSLQIPNHDILVAIVLIGPMQVAGRVALTVSGDFTTLRVGGGVTAVLVVAFAVLSFAPTNFVTLVVFAVLYGSANGIMTILRGTAVAELFGRERYAILNGALSLPAMLARAAAPLALAAAWDLTGSAHAVFIAGLFLAGAGALGLHVAARAALAFDPEDALLTQRVRSAPENK